MLPPRCLLQARSLGTLAAKLAGSASTLAPHVVQQVSDIQALWLRVPANGCGSSKHGQRVPNNSFKPTLLRGGACVLAIR